MDSHVAPDAQAMGPKVLPIMRTLNDMLGSTVRLENDDISETFEAEFCRVTHTQNPGPAALVLKRLHLGEESYYSVNPRMVGIGYFDYPIVPVNIVKLNPGSEFADPVTDSDYETWGRGIMRWPS